MTITNLEPYSPEWVAKNGIPYSIWLKAYIDPEKDFIIPWDPRRPLNEKLPPREYPLTKEQHDELDAQRYQFLPLDPY
jgi:hypothetical protein